jgi:hypothetical protein
LHGEAVKAFSAGSKAAADFLAGYTAQEKDSHTPQ